MPFARSRYPDAGDRPPARAGLVASDPSRSGSWSFAATLILLFGALNVVRRSDVGAPVASSSHGRREPDAQPGAARVRPRPVQRRAARCRAPARHASASASARGRGDPRRCRRHRRLRPATTTRRRPRLVAAIPGTVFTAGDNAYRAARPSSSTTATTRPGAPSGTGRDRRPATTTGRRRTSPATSATSATAAAPQGTQLVLVRPRGVARDRPRLGLLRRRRLRCGLSRRVAGSPPTSRRRRAQCTLAIWHHPRFSSGFHGNDGDGRRRSGRRSTTPAPTSSSTATTTTTSGSRPRTPTATTDGVRGIREFVVGTGGAELRPFASDAANSELRSPPPRRHPVRSAHGVVRLDVHPDHGRRSATPGTAPCH